MRWVCFALLSAISLLLTGPATADSLIDAKFRVVHCVSQLAPRLASRRASANVLAEKIANKCMAILDNDCQPRDSACQHSTAEIIAQIRPIIRDTAWGLVTSWRTAPATEQLVPHAEDCSKTVARDGYYTRAQSKCGFRIFPKQLASAARKCNAHFASSVTVRLLHKGMADFDTAVQAKGRAAVCDYLRASRSE